MALETKTHLSKEGPSHPLRQELGGAQEPCSRVTRSCQWAWDVFRPDYLGNGLFLSATVADISGTAEGLETFFCFQDVEVTLSLTYH